MNQLSWMIYAASVAEGLRGILVAGAVISGTTSAFYTFTQAVENEVFTTWRAGVMACVSCAILASLTPSSNTIYAIAASELGEEVIKSNTANKAMQALDKWLDKQIADKEDGQ